MKPVSFTPSAIAVRKVKVGKIGGDPTVVFAVEELRKYLKKIDPGLAVDILKYDAFDPGSSDVLWVGLDSALAARVPHVANPRLDDAVLIEVQGGAGVITGSNPRSVLFAVYRFLKELGCNWVRPGEEGEIIPRKTLENLTVTVSEKAAYRHRSICIEGSNSIEHVRAVIDWMPKMNLNGYFIQFLVPFTFFDRWYSHYVNPRLKSEKFTRDDAVRIKAQMVEDVRLRNLLFHDVGHGWTCEPFGIEGTSWDPDRVYDIGDKVNLLAKVRGERKLHGNIPLNTNLCYSQSEVRETITSAIALYCEEHPEVDYLHFWLADGQNNNCECDDCKSTRPSDFYVMMMNALDKKLSAKGLETKIVAILYVDLLWAPEKERIENEDRFALLFAPITRTYEKSLAEITIDPAASPESYVRNQLKFPKTLAGNAALLAGWKDVFKGDCFDFDYHLMWDHYYDPGYYRCAQVLFEDMKHLDQIGLNGMLSCQIQRLFHPTGLPVYLMARVLWDRKIEFQPEAEKYHLDAFGDDGLLVLEYLKKLSDIFDPASIRDFAGKEKFPAGHYDAIGITVATFAPTIEKNLVCEGLSENQKKSWSYLTIHGPFCLLLADVAAVRAEGDADKLARLWKGLEDYLGQHELDLQNTFDVFEFVYAFKRNGFSKTTMKLD